MSTLSDVFALRGAMRGNLVVTFEAEENSSLQAVENLEDKGVLSSGAVVGDKSTASLVVEKHQEEEGMALLPSKKKRVEEGLLLLGAVNSLLQAVENLEDKGVLLSDAVVGEKFAASLAVEKHHEEEGVASLPSKKNRTEEGVFSSGADQEAPRGG